MLCFYLGRHQREVLGGDDLVRVDVVLRHERLARVLPGPLAELGRVLDFVCLIWCVGWVSDWTGVNVNIKAQTRLARQTHTPRHDPLDPHQS